MYSVLRKSIIHDTNGFIRASEPTLFAAPTP